MQNKSPEFIPGINRCYRSLWKVLRYNLCKQPLCADFVTARFCCNNFGRWWEVYDAFINEGFVIVILIAQKFC